MTLEEKEDKITLQTSVDMVYMSPRYYHTIKGTEAEAEIRAKLEAFKNWANKLINEKLK